MCIYIIYISYIHISLSFHSLTDSQGSSPTIRAFTGCDSTHCFTDGFSSGTLEIRLGDVYILKRPSWLIGWLVDWLIGWLVGWLIGWLVETRSQFLEQNEISIVIYSFLNHFIDFMQSVTPYHKSETAWTQDSAGAGAYRCSLLPEWLSSWEGVICFP